MNIDASFALCNMQLHLLAIQLTEKDRVLGLVDRAAAYEVVLLHTVAEQVEVLTRGLLLGLVLLSNVQAFFLFEGLVTHLFEALSTPIYHVHLSILIV